jgi:hypothetical protein
MDSLMRTFSFLNSWLADFEAAERAAYLAGLRDGGLIAAVSLLVLYLLFDRARTNKS